MCAVAADRGKNEHLIRKFYYEARKVSPSKLNKLFFIFFYILLADSIATVGPRFLAPVYGLYLSERHNYKVAASVLQVGYILGKNLIKYRKNDDLQVHFTLGSILLMIAPWLSHITFAYSDLIGPNLGPIVSMIPFYFSILHLSVSKLCHHEPFMAEIPLIIYFLFRLKSNRTLSIYSAISACNTVSVFFFLWCASEIFSSYLHYRKLKVEIPNFLKTSNKIKHAILIYFFIGALLTHTTGPLQCSWFLRVKLPILYNTPNATYKILDWKNSNTGTIIVADYKRKDTGHMTLLRCDHSIVGITNKKDPNSSPYFVFHYQEFTEYISQEKIKSTRDILQIGLGAGTSTRALASSKTINLDVVELDKYVYKAARKYMGLPEIRNIYIMDGREYLQKHAKEAQYDIIINDVFTGGVVDPNLGSINAFYDIRKALRRDGILVMNYFGNIHSKATRILYNTITSVFRYTSVHLESKNESELGEAYNIVIFASDKQIEFDFHDAILNEDMSSSRKYALIKFLDSKTDIKKYCWGTNGKRRESKNCPVIDDFGKNSLNELQYPSAESHWKILREAFGMKFWTFI